MASIVAVRVDQALDAGIEFQDGRLTHFGSFQKVYSQSEFRDYLESCRKVRSHMAALGIAYVFKDKTAETKYLADLAFRRRENYRQDALDEFKNDRLATRYIDLAMSLGRLPLPQEFKNYERLLERFGSPQRVERLAGKVLNPESLAEAQQRKREDLLTYLSMLRLQGLRPPPFRSLSEEIRADIKTLWRTYQTAIHEGDKFLFQLGKPEIVREACLRAPIGKKLPDSIYIHPSAEQQLEVLLRIVLFAARQVVGDVDYDLIKISLDGREVSFLKYEDFDHRPHPELLHCIRVYLPRASHTIRDYSDSANPPILHRKDTFVDPLYPHYDAFRRLTEQEETHGLLSRPDIGYKQSWLRLLRETGVRIEDHSVQAL